MEVEECITMLELKVWLIMHIERHVRKDIRSLLLSCRGACKSGLVRAFKDLIYGKLFML